MAHIFHQPVGRRDFLRITAMGVAAIATGCQTRSGRAGAGTHHLALLSDTHVPGDRVNGHRGFNPWENLRRVAPEVVAARPEATILCGDAARLEGKVEDYEELKALLAPVAAVSPVFIGMGNHDERGNFRKVFGARPEGAPEVGDRQILALEYPELRILVLDSLLRVNMTPGLLGKAQREWLGKYLDEHSDRPVVLFVHHTLEDRDGDLLDADRLFGLIRPHRHVKAIFYGHSHVWERKEREGVQLVNLPAVGYNFNDQQPIGWVEAQFGARGVDLTLRAIGGNLADNGRTVSVRWG